MTLKIDCSTNISSQISENILQQSSEKLEGLCVTTVMLQIEALQSLQ